MTGWEAVAIAAAGFGAGTINTVVGSGTLLTFPVLLGFGYAPVQANVSNTVGLVPGGLSGTHGYREELAGQRRRVDRSRRRDLRRRDRRRDAAAHAAGVGVQGDRARASSPSALVLVVAQPWLSTRLEAYRAGNAVHGAPWTPVAVFAIGVYGGYFGAAQGILLLAVLGLSLSESLQRVERPEERAGDAGEPGRGGDLRLRRRRELGASPALIAAGSVVGGQVGAQRRPAAAAGGAAGR